ncbi:glycoside hydrolase family 43 protein [Pedobacter sandarakinus]|uniref:glycoside hydrolase family 43 protein n=1 Tax=Pedobacter sandarakinus TaxID=353156 RepID=UPI0022478CA2|nr:glycoside hydrolase family 43 protein [Pedobacter sandarakinus]MCX2574124.1 glycoside hydrolase family 43 protein [Pedobacter sandarakinus]
MSHIKKPHFNGLMVICVLLFAAGCAKDHQTSTDPTANRPDTVLRFSNPIKQSVNNPYLYKKDSKYYFMKSGGNYISLSVLTKVEYLGSADSKTIFAYDPKAGSNTPLYNITSPEIYFLNDRWYIYFGADSDGSLGQKRIYVIENTNANPLEGSWTLKGKLADPTSDFMATDGTILQYNNQLYFIWSGWATATMPVNTIKQGLYISRMASPTALTGARVQISDPTLDYEKYATTNNGTVSTQFLNQNPEVIKNSTGRPFLTFTAGSCANDNVGLGLLTLRTGGDPMVASDWTKSTNAVFTGNGVDSFGPGFNGFFKSGNDAEDWIIYDTNQFPGSGCGSSRSAVIQKIGWKADGTPDLGVAVSTTTKLARPTR